MLEITPLVLAVVPVVIALVQVVKKFGINSKYAPVAAIAFGIGLTYLVLPDAILKDVLLQGLILGLSASGLYSGGKKLVE